MLGREVAALLSEVRPAGNHQTSFDGTGLSSGVYMYKRSAGHYTQTKKFTLVR